MAIKKIKFDNISLKKFLAPLVFGIISCCSMRHFAELTNLVLD